MRKRAADRFGTRDTEVQEWEIAVMHRLHHATDDSCARVLWSRADPAKTEREAGRLPQRIIPAMDELPGFCSLSLLIDRQPASARVTSVYRDRAAMEATREHDRQMREEFAPRMGVEITEEAEFDVVLHNLRVPELV